MSRLGGGIGRMKNRRRIEPDNRRPRPCIERLHIPEPRQESSPWKFGRVCVSPMRLAAARLLLSRHLNERAPSGITDRAHIFPPRRIDY